MHMQVHVPGDKLTIKARVKYVDNGQCVLTS